MKVLPYLIVLITAIAGMNVMAVLTLGTLLCGAIGIGSHLLGASGSYDLFGWFAAMGNGIIGMGELIIIAMMAGGMLGEGAGLYPNRELQDVAVGRFPVTRDGGPHQ